MERVARDTPKRARLEARRLAVGQAIPVSSLEVIAHLLGKEYGVPPWKILEAPAEDVMQAWALFTEIQPKGK